MKKISFVIPCYSSEKTISVVIEELNNAMIKKNIYNWEYILVDDCSPDDTFEVIKNICNTYKNSFGIKLARNFGQHSALMAGFQYASGDIIVCLDDDGQTPGNEVWKLLDKIEEGYDVVYAEYSNKKHSRFRNIGSKINSTMTEYLLEKPKNLFVSSYFATQRFIIEEVIRYKNAFPYVLGLVLRSTKNIANVEVNHRERFGGDSGYSMKKLLSLWINGFTAFSVKPLRIATCLGFFVATAGSIYALFLILRKIIYPTKVLLGWSSTMAVIMVLGGVVLIVLGIIGEYIGRIYLCMNNAPQYIIRDLVNIQHCKNNNE